MNFSITRRGDYGLVAALYLAQKTPGELTQIHEIAQGCHLPEPFLAQILRLLVRGGVVRSRKGVRGGFSLSRSADRISFLEVLEALEGPVAVNRCQNPALHCEHEENCAMESVWSRVQEALVRILGETRLADAVFPGRFPFVNANQEPAAGEPLPPR